MAEPPTGSSEAEIGRAIAEALEKLLTEKHLYQSVELPFNLESLAEACVDLRTDMFERSALSEQLQYLRALWMPC